MFTGIKEALIMCISTTNILWHHKGTKLLKYYFTIIASSAKLSPRKSEKIFRQGMKILKNPEKNLHLWKLGPDLEHVSEYFRL